MPRIGDGPLSTPSFDPLEDPAEVGGVGGAGDAGAVDPGAAPAAPARPSRLERLAGEAKEKIVEVAWKELTTGRAFDLASAPLGDRGALAVRAFEKVIPPTDPLVAGDPHRAVYSREATERHTWLRTGGIVDANLGLTVPIAVGGASASLGFSTSGALDYSVLAPYPLEVGAVSDLARNMTTDLPISAAKARAMARGAELSIRGRGTAGASGSIGAGASAPVGPLTAGVTVGVSGSTSVTGDLTLNVKRLDGDRVYVRIGESDAQSFAASIGVRGGVTGARGALPDLDLPGGAVGAFVGRTATDTVAKEIEKRLSFQATASASSSRASSEVAAFVLDLSTPAGAKAYEALVRLDMGPASRLAAEGKAERVTYDETSETSTTGIDLRAGGAKLLLRDSLRRDREGRLEGDGGDPLVIHHALFRRSSEGLFSGTRNVVWEGTSLRREGGGEPETFFHLAFDKRDGATRQSEVDEMRRFAATIAATPSAAARFERDEGFLSSTFGGAYGESTTKLDLYFTRAGLTRIAATSEQEVMAAFAESARQIEGTERPPAWSVPADADESRALIRRWRTATPHPRSTVDERQRLASQYERRFGRSISDDASALESAETLARHVTSMAGKPESEWAAVFADLGAQAKFDLWKHVGALNALAGTNETLVHELSMKGDRVDLAMLDEGAIASAESRIGAALAPP